MVRKIAIIIPMFFLCLGLNNCKSPEGPEEPNPNYRYNVEVIYSDVAEGESDFPLFLYYGLHDAWGAFNSGYIEMTKIGENKARCYLSKVRIIPDGLKHWVSVVDPNKEPWWHRGENIYVQGAYDLEISTNVGYSQLNFRMSKE
jgi:hypothetical protein